MRSGSTASASRRTTTPTSTRTTGENQPTVATGQVSEWDVPEGSLFVLGDHRGGSTDSRRSSVGFVGVDDVVGRAWLRFFPLDTLGILQTPTYPELEEASQPAE